MFLDKLRGGISSAGSGIRGLTEEDAYLSNFADIVRTHIFDYYPHVNDVEANEKLMKII